MIFYLTNSLRINESDNEEYKKGLLHSIRNLAVSATENSHSIMGDYEILEDCIRFFNGDDELCGLFRHIVDNWYTTPIPQCITYYIEVVRENPQERTINRCVISQRVYSDFFNQSSTFPCNLVCEDDTDCQFYQFLVYQFMKQHNCLSSVRFFNVGTGGCEHAYDNIQNHIKINQVCLCILDSDKCYPGKVLKDVVLDCVRLDNHLSGYKCVVLNVHEIENLLPYNYMIPAVMRSESYNKYPSCRDQLRHFIIIANSPNAEYLLPYYDLKNGVKKQDEVLQNADHMKFAEKCWTEDKELNNGITFQNYVASVKKDNCICLRLSRTVLEDTLSFINNQTSLGALPNPTLRPFQILEWDRIGQELLNWGYSSGVEAVS